MGRARRPRRSYAPGVRRPGFSRLLDVERIARRGPWRSGVAMAADAAAYVAAHAWCPGVRRVRWGLAVPPVFGVFLCELATPPAGSGDHELWSVAGDLPNAYLVTDRARTPRQALAGYCELMEAWIAAVRAGASLRGVFPVRAAPTREHAELLAQRVAFLRERVLRRAGGRGGVLVSADAPQRAPAAGRLPGDGVRPGLLVVDNLGRDALAVEPTARPAPDWLAAQRDRRVVALAEARWWRLYPTSGGAVYAPEPLLAVAGVPTALQHAILWRNANNDARARIEALLGRPQF